jgi:hypothetical protein
MYLASHVKERMFNLLARSGTSDVTPVGVKFL